MRSNALKFFVLAVGFFTFFLIADPALAETVANAAGKSAEVVTTSSSECSTSGVSFTGCIAAMVYYVGPGLGAWILGWASYFLSSVVYLSLQSIVYAQNFLTIGWVFVRDVANMFFIFILVYIAFMIMFKAETTKTISALAWTIAMALLINFSFFFTRLVIDAGNIIGTQFYNALKDLPALSATNQAKDLAYGIMQALGVQDLLAGQMLAKVQAATGGAWSSLIVTSVIYIAVALIFWIMIFAFVHVGLKFLMRIVGLWLLIIASPFAFLFKAFQPLSKYFDAWLSLLFKFSFYPAIFLFMFFIMNLFLTDLLGRGNLLSTLGTAKGTNMEIVATLSDVSIRLALAIALIYVALKAADWVVGEGSGWATAMVSGTGRGGVALSGFAGRLTLGRGLGGVLGRAGANAERNAGRSTITSSLLRGSGNFLQRRTYDVRNAPGVSRATNILSRVNLGQDKTGINLGKGSSATEKGRLVDRAAKALKRKQEEELTAKAEKNTQQAEVPQSTERTAEERDAFYRDLGERAARADGANQPVVNVTQAAIPTTSAVPQIEHQASRTAGSSRSEQPRVEQANTSGRNTAAAPVLSSAAQRIEQATHTDKDREAFYKDLADHANRADGATHAPLTVLPNSSPTKDKITETLWRGAKPADNLTLEELRRHSELLRKIRNELRAGLKSVKTAEAQKESAQVSLKTITYSPTPPPSDNDNDNEIQHANDNKQAPEHANDNQSPEKAA
jgi:hypothetical protein